VIVRAVVVLVSLVAVSGVASAQTSPPTGPAVTVGPYTGVATALVDQYRHIENSSVVSDSKDVYTARFTYSFRIRNGIVEGRGTGVYLSATWTLNGTSDGASFGCSPPVSTTPFNAIVSGSATQTQIRLTFRLVGARETNADYDCGAGYTGYATDSTYLADSLEKVQEAQPNGEITISRANPRIPPLRKLEETGDDSDKRIRLYEWTITINAPAGSGSGNTGGGSSGGSGGPTANPNGACTINGTPGNDVLAGSSGRDVICGLGGNDVIRGNGGADTLRGGAGNDQLLGGAGNDAIDGGAGADVLRGDAGNDLLLARDGVRDTVVGGAGRDRARIDRGRDRVQGVETIA
jgi:Ca2+-binding RTX toxin-like protein